MKRVLCLLLVTTAVLLWHCSPESEADRGDSATPSADTMSQRSIDSVLADHTSHLLSIPGVVGTGIGECEGKPCIKVFAADRTDEIDKQVPETLEGYVVDVVVTGEFKALDTNDTSSE